MKKEISMRVRKVISKQVTKREQKAGGGEKRGDYIMRIEILSSLWEVFFP